MLEKNKKKLGILLTCFLAVYSIHKIFSQFILLSTLWKQVREIIHVNTIEDLD